MSRPAIMRRAWHPWAATVAVLGLALAIGGCGSSTTHATHSPHSPQAQPSTRQSYVALGDSYTSYPGTTDQVDAACQRSRRNYPHLLAEALGYHLTDVSCSGATTADFTSRQYPGTAPQFAALTARTRLVTVGIGANDFRLSALLLGGCTLVRNDPSAGQRPCEAKTFAQVMGALGQLVPALVATYRAIRARAPQARIIAVGYPQLLGRSGGCTSFPLATGDVEWVNAINLQLNRDIEQAAGTAKVEYLDVATASMGHGICSTDPWINGLKVVPGRALPAHPFANEQQAVATMLAARLKG
ncbi:MAG: SGNH/GDSL hydrolase family protein [Marmoricola sp.]